MTDLEFQVVDAAPEPYAAVPTIVLRLRITERGGTPVHAIALRCQIRIEPQRRRYRSDETEALVELFGEPGQWGDSLRPFSWTHVSTDGAVVHRRHRDRPADHVHLRLRGLGHALLPRARRRRDPVAPALLRHDVRRRRRRARGDTDRVARGGVVPLTGVGLAGDDGRPLPRTARSSPSAARPSKRCCSSAPPGPSRRGTWSSSDSSKKPERAHRERSLRRGPRGRRRGALRGLRAVPVPRIGAEEPGPVAVGRPVPARLRRGRRIGALAQPHRVHRRSRIRAAVDGARARPPGAAPVGRGCTHGTRRPRAGARHRAGGRRRPVGAVGRGGRTGARPSSRCACSR